MMQGRVKAIGMGKSSSLVALLVVLLVTACSRGPASDEASIEPADEASFPADTQPLEELEPITTEDSDSDGALKQRQVRVYYPSVSGNGLIGENKEIFATATAEDMAKQIVADLISGPTNKRALRALPSGTRLRQAYVLNDGTAFLDFSSDLVEGIGGGSMEELLTVYSIVDSVVLNVREISRVGILIEGKTIDTLNGHMDLRSPLKPDASMILERRNARAAEAPRDRAVAQLVQPNQATAPASD